MPNVGNATTLVIMNPVSGKQGVWSGAGQSAISGSFNSVNMSMNTLLNNSPAPTTYPLGNYSIQYTASDSNGNQFTCTPNPVGTSMTASTASLNLTTRVSIPTNISITSLPSPLTITVTVTNVGGGGGWDPNNG